MRHPAAVVAIYIIYNILYGLLGHFTVPIIGLFLELSLLSFLAYMYV